MKYCSLCHKRILLGFMCESCYKITEDQRKIELDNLVIIGRNIQWV